VCVCVCVNHSRDEPESFLDCVSVQVLENKKDNTSDNYEHCSYVDQSKKRIGKRIARLRDKEERRDGFIPDRFRLSFT